MPSDKKRVNLTIPDEIYERLQVYKQKMGITNDATACFQLIVQQLTAQENGEVMIKLLRELSVEQLLQASREGLEEVKAKLPPADEHHAAGEGL